MDLLRVFVSSPGDVALEREISRKLLQRLAHEFSAKVTIEPYCWEYEPMDFTEGFQPQIERPSNCEILVCIFFSRLGTPLTIDGQRYPSGTAYELLEAKAVKAKRLAASENPLPHILVFRNTTEIKINSRMGPADHKVVEDVQALDSFLEEHTLCDGEIVGAVMQYGDTVEFEQRLEAQLRRLFAESVSSDKKDNANKNPASGLSNPYRGLFAFDFKNADYYFGRGAAAGAIVRAFQSQLSQKRPRFVMIVGASGAGKSSLARAGVLPLLLKPGVIAGDNLWRRAAMRPAEGGGNLFLALARGLLRTEALPELSSQEDAQSLAARLQRSPDAAVEVIRGALQSIAKTEWLNRLHSLETDAEDFDRAGRSNDADRCRSIRAQLAPPQARLAIVIDQFEEAFTGATPSDQLERFTTFLQRLAEAPDAGSFIIVTISSAFLSMATENAQLRELGKQDGVYVLAPPTEEEFAQMIRLPAWAVGLRFELKDGMHLDDQILLDARAHADCLPLVEFCLEELAKRSLKTGVMTFAEYERLGKIFGVLTKRANETLASLTSAQRNALGNVLEQLVNRDPNNPQSAVRRTATWREVAPSPEAEAFVEAFANARLFVVDANEKGERCVSVVHEALLREWEPAKEWIGLDENQAFLKSRERLERRFQEWTAAPERSRSDFLLPSGVPLAEAQALLRRYPHAFEEMEKYVENSVRRQRRRRLATYAIAGSVVIVSLWGYYQYVSQQLQSALASQLLTQSTHDVLLKDYANAEIAAAKSLALRDTPEARYVLLEARSGGLKLMSHSRQKSPEAGYSAVSRDGQLAALLIKDGQRKPSVLSIISPSDFQEQWRIAFDETPAYVAFSKEMDGARYIAIARKNRTVGVWELRPGKSANLACDIRPPAGDPGRPTKRIPSMAFHPSRRWLALCSDDKSLWVWNVSATKPELLWKQPEAHGTAVHGIAFDDSGNLLASGGGDYLVKVWDVGRGASDYQKRLVDASHPSTAPLYELNGHTDSVFAVAFSRDGRRLASGGYDCIIRIWDLENTIVPTPDPGAPNQERAAMNSAAPVHPMMVTLKGHTGTIRDVTFSEDGTLLLSSGNDATARLWHVAGGGALIATIKPLCGDLTAISLNSFDKTLYCSGTSGWSAWSVDGGDGVERLWNGGATIGSLAFDRSGQRLAVGGEDGKVRLWDAGALTVLEGDGEYVNGVAFSPNGRWLAAGGEGKEVLLWDCSDWSRIRPPAPLKHEGAIWGLAFSPNSDWLLSSNGDDAIRLRRWDAHDDWRMQEETKTPLNASVYTLAVEPDSHWAASGDSDAVIKVWDVGRLDGKPTSQLPTAAEFSLDDEGETNIWSVAVCPDPLCVFAGAQDGRVYRWAPGQDTYSARTSDEDAKVNHVINSISYNAQRRWIAAGGDGDSVEIYDQSLERLFSLPGHDGTVWMLAFDPEGQCLAYGGGDRIIRVWDLDEATRILQSATPQELLVEAEAHTGLSFSEATGKPSVVHTKDMGPLGDQKAPTASTASGASPSGG